MQWFIGYVRSCQERNVAAALTSLGVDNYVPVQRVRRQWSDRKVWRDSLVLPRVVFIRCDEMLRRQLLNDIGYLTGFMMDCSTHRPAVVPENELDAFRRFVTSSPTPVSVQPGTDLSIGDAVRIKEGPMKGMQCYVTRISNKTFVCVNLELIGVAIAEISSDCLEKIQEK